MNKQCLTLHSSHSHSSWDSAQYVDMWRTWPFSFMIFAIMQGQISMCPKISNPSYCVSLFHDMLDAFLMQFSHLPLLFFHHRVPDCLGVLLKLYIPHDGHHFKLHWLYCAFCNSGRLQCRAFLHDHLTQLRHSCNKICAIFFWLEPDNIDCCLQSKAVNPRGKLWGFVPFSIPL